LKGARVWRVFLSAFVSFSFPPTLPQTHAHPPPQKTNAPASHPEPKPKPKQQHNKNKQVWLVEDGKVETYPGDFEDYRSSLAKEIVAELDESAAAELALREAAEEKARTTLDLRGLTI
jgi:hypothetical protein